MKQRGFIALMSAVVISATLLIVCASGSLSGFYTRSNVLDGELKERSASAASACADVAELELAQDSAYTGNEKHVLNTLDACSISSVADMGDAQREFFIQATSSDSAVTTLRIRYASDSGKTLSWQEVP